MPMSNVTLLPPLSVRALPSGGGRASVATPRPTQASCLSDLSYNLHVAPRGVPNQRPSIPDWTYVQRPTLHVRTVSSLTAGCSLSEVLVLLLLTGADSRRRLGIRAPHLVLPATVVRLDIILATYDPPRRGIGRFCGTVGRERDKPSEQR